jgi:hypothetical protein
MDGRTRSLLLILLACVAASTLLAGTSDAARPVSSGTMLYSKQFDRWTTFVVRTDEDVMFRAGTMAENVSRVRFMATFFGTNCSDMTTELIFSGLDKLRNDVRRHYPDMRAVARIDRRDPHRATISQAAGNLGESMLRITLEIDDESSFVTDLLQGSTLRIKLSGDGNDDIYRFSLAGSSPSLVDVVERCTSFNELLKQNNDENYFNDEDSKTRPSPKSSNPEPGLDESFF